jgi:hypothetical protein
MVMDVKETKEIMVKVLLFDWEGHMMPCMLGIYKLFFFLLQIKLLVSFL